MANGGAFGNPLTTGIALNFEVDMTPYRQMMRDNLQFAQTQAAERKKKEKEFQDILKNISYDDSKIHTRMRDDARIEYAATIEDVMELKKKNDFGGIMNRIAKFDSKLNNYVDATTNFRAYEKALEDGKSWVDMDYVNAYNNPDKFDDRYLIDNFSDVAIYDKEAGVFSAQAIPKQDEVAFVNKYMQGTKDQFVRDKGKIKRSGFLSETGDYVYLKAKSADPESFYQELGLAWLGGGRNNIEHMRRKMGLKPEDLEGTIDTPSGPMAKSAYYATEFMKGVAEPKMYSEELRRPVKDTGKGGGGMTFEEKYTVSDFSEKIKDTQLSGIPSGTEMVGKAFNPTGDITSKAKRGYERLVTVSPDSYESIDGGAIRKPVRSGETVTINMVPMGIVALKGSKDDRVFASYRYVTGGGELPKRIHMHYEPLNRDELKDKNNIEFRDYAGLTDDEFVSYYNEVAGMAGFPKFKGGASTSGTQSSESEDKEELRRVEVTQKEIEDAAKARGMSVNDYKAHFKKKGIEVIVK